MQQIMKYQGYVRNYHHLESMFVLAFLYLKFILGSANVGFVQWANSA